MKKQNENGTGYYFVDKDDVDKFEKINKNQNTYINDAGKIVICFNKYEVAAGAQGSPEFEKCKFLYYIKNIRFFLTFLLIDNII